MANKKLRVVYFWTDERMMVDDFQRGFSERMTDWANRFFGRYKFELSVEPPAADRKFAPRASKYLLRKTDGVRPDWRLSEYIIEEEVAQQALLEQQMADNKKKQLDADRLVEAAERRLRVHDAEVSRLRTALINSTHGTFSAALDELEAADARRPPFEKIVASEKAKADHLREEHTRLFAESMAASDRASAKLDKRWAYENVFREQMAEAYRNHKIGSRKAVNVIFCRAAGGLSMRRGKYGFMGMTHDLESTSVVALKTMKPVWPFPFIAISLAGDRMSLAHELVHAAGHGGHPPDRMIRILEKRVSGLTFPRTVGPGAKPSLFRDVKYAYEDVERYEMIPGGYFDGAENDIMNYNDDDLEPDKFVLNKEDQELMNKAWFGDP